MSVSIDRILRKNGLIMGVSYAKASTNRGAVLCVSLGRGSAEPLTTSLMLDGRDFHETYAEAVRLIAQYWGVSDDAEIMARLIATKEAFLTAKNLTTREVVRVAYAQVVERT